MPRQHHATVDFQFPGRDPCKVSSRIPSNDVLTRNLHQRWYKEAPGLCLNPRRLRIAAVWGVFSPFSLNARLLPRRLHAIRYCLGHSNPPKDLVEKLSCAVVIHDPHKATGMVSPQGSNRIPRSGVVVPGVKLNKWTSFARVVKRHKPYYRVTIFVHHRELCARQLTHR